MKTNVGIIDDQQLFLKSLSTLIRTFESFDVCIDATNGKDFISKLQNSPLKPDVVLIDVSMPVMNGTETAAFLTMHYPAIRKIALSINDDDLSILGMFRAGCCAYLLKDINPRELEHALREVVNKGYYNGDSAHISKHSLAGKLDIVTETELTRREIDFIKMASSDLTYKEIAKRMNISERTVDGYRESIFEKFKVKSRVGMVLEALQRHIIIL